MTPEERLQKLQRLKELQALKAGQQVNPIAAGLVGAGQALTFNAIPRLYAAGQTAVQNLTGQEGDYSSNLRQAQATEKRIAEQQPIPYYGAQIAGGLLGGQAIGATKTGQAISGMLGTGSIPARIAKAGVAGGVGGAAYGAGGAEIGEVPSGAAIGGLLGAGIGSAIPAVPALAKSAVNKLTPQISSTEKEVAKPIIDLAKKHKIDLSVSDIAGSNFYKRAVAQGRSMPLSGAEAQSEKVQNQINKAVSRTLGKESDKITPEYLDSVRLELGDRFQDFTKGKEFTVTADAYTKIDEMANLASRKAYGVDGEALFNQYKSELESLVDDRGLIKGDKLDKFRRDLSSVARRQSNSDIGQVASDFENAVVDIISDSDPKIAKEITDTKYKYKNFKTIIAPSARNQATGDINPAALTNEVMRSFGRDKFATGRAGDLGEIARLGQSMRLPNSSGTAENLMAQRGLFENVIRSPQYVANAMLQAYNRNPKNVNMLMEKQNQLPALYQSGIKTPILSGQLGGMLGAQ